MIADPLCLNCGWIDKVSGKWTSLFNNNRTLITNQSLVISPVNPSDTGIYQCEASNGVGNSISALIELQVHRKSFVSLKAMHRLIDWREREKERENEGGGRVEDMASCLNNFDIAMHWLVPPEVHLSQDYMAVRRGSASVLRCVVAGDPPLNIQWKKDGIPIDGAAQPRYTFYQTKFLSFSAAFILYSRPIMPKYNWYSQFNLHIDIISLIRETNCQIVPLEFLLRIY